MKNVDFRKYPALLTTIPLSAGIFISYFCDFKLSAFSNVYFTSFLILLAIISLKVYNKIRNVFSLNFSVYFLLVFVFGVISMQFRYYKLDENCIYKNIDSLKNKNTVLYGTLSEEPDVKDDRIKIVVDADSLSQGGKLYPYNGTVIATIYKNKFTEKFRSKLSYGDKISVTGKIEDLPHRRNPGEFDYGEYLKLHDIEAMFTSFGYDKIKNTPVLHPDFLNSEVLFPVKNYINKTVDLFSQGDEREFLKGLLLGEKSSISQETKQNFINAGVAHIIAVSGLNVAYVLIVLNGILLLLPVSRRYKVFIIIPCLLFYMYLTGNSASIVRATVMAIIILLSQLLERKPNSYNVVAFSAFVILLFDPRQLFDAGFILSFSAILSIVYFNPKLEAIPEKIKWYAELNPTRKLNRYLKETVLLLLATLSAQIGTIPVTAVMFNKISVISLLANVVAIPVSNISLALGFTAVLFSTFSLWAAAMFSAANNFLMHYLLKFVALCANFDFSYIETYSVDILLFFVYYIIIFSLFTLNKINYKPRIAIIIFFIANFALFKSIINDTGKAKITFLDTGNSNCSLISMPQGTNILINTGTAKDKYNSAERNVIPYLKGQGIGKIDLILITNLDKDELLNLYYLTKNFNVNRILLPEYYKILFDDNLINEKFRKQHIEFVSESKIINQKGNFRIYLYYDNTLKGESMLAQFVYGSQSFIFDDAEKEAEDYLNYAMIPDDSKTKVLRLPLSGSFAYTSADFIVKANPEYAVISYSKADKRKNPGLFAKSLENTGIKVGKINETGAMIFETDGNKTELMKWK